MAQRKQNVKVHRIVYEHRWIEVFADERHVTDIESIEGVTCVSTPMTNGESLMVFYDTRYDVQEIAQEIEALNNEPSIPDVFRG